MHGVEGFRPNPDGPTVKSLTDRLHEGIQEIAFRSAAAIATPLTLGQRVGKDHKAPIVDLRLAANWRSADRAEITGVISAITRKTVFSAGGKAEAASDLTRPPPHFRSA